MSIDTFLAQNTAVLSAAGIESARLDCLILLEDVTGTDRAHLLAHPEIILDDTQQTALDSMIGRRAQSEPLAYIRGISEFYGRTFMVNEHVLVPRPESEDMIELLSEYGSVGAIIDIGTGSGALAISAALEKPEAKVIAIDIDEQCLMTARHNAKQLGAVISTKHGDLLKGVTLSDYPDPIVILANLPYVPDEYPINAAAKHEPGLALFGGRDGLDLYRVLFDQLSHYEDQPIIILTEALESQHRSLAGIAKNAGFDLVKTKGLIQSFSILP